MKLKFKKLQTISETITVEFGNRTETYSKESFSDLLENGIEFTEDDLGDKDIAGIQLKTNVNGLEKIKDFKNGVDFYVEGKNGFENKLFAWQCINSNNNITAYTLYESPNTNDFCLLVEDEQTSICNLKKNIENQYISLFDSSYVFQRCDKDIDSVERDLENEEPTLYCFVNTDNGSHYAYFIKSETSYNFIGFTTQIGKISGFLPDFGQNQGPIMFKNNNLESTEINAMFFYMGISRYDTYYHYSRYPEGDI